MERLTLRDLKELRIVVARLTEVPDLDGMVDGLLAALPSMLATDFVAYNEIDPRQRRVVYRESPSVASVIPEGPDILRAHFHEHPLIAHFARPGNAGVRAISDFLTLRQFRRTGLHQEFFRRIGVDHQMVLSIDPRVGVAVNRGGRDFTERERLLLELIGPHFHAAHWALTRLSAMADTIRLLALGVDALRAGVVVLAPRERMRMVTAPARHWLGQYFDPPRRRGELPDGLRRWLRQAHARRDEDPPRTAPPLVVEHAGRSLVVRLVSNQAGEVLILEERASEVRPEALERLGLTAREAQVLFWVAQGKSNADVATLLGTRPKTVSKHLERVFPKLGVETRTAAAVAALRLLADLTPALF